MTALAMVFRLAHTAPDGVRTYHDRTHRIAAVIGPAAAIRARWRQGYRDFDLYRAATAVDLVMLIRFDLDVEGLGDVIAAALRLDGAGWKRITAADLERLVDDDGTRAS